MIELETVMRDGTILRADAYRPAGDGPWPVLLVRSPYGKRDAGVLARLDPEGAARRGYLVIVQDCRGRFASDGDWEPLLHEGADGYDTVAWAASLPESDGWVGTYGPSYLGYTQQAAKAMLPPRLAAAVPAFTWADPYDGLIRRGGAHELGLMTQWTLNNGFDVMARRYRDRPDELRPQLAALDSALHGRTVWELPADDLPALRRLGLSTPKPDRTLIRQSTPIRRSELIRQSAPDQPSTPDQPSAPIRPSALPTLTVAGWFDCFLQGSLDSHVAARDAGAPAMLIVGPWTHDSQALAVGDRSLAGLELDFLDQFLKPDHGSHAAEAPVMVFVMGISEWRRYQSWPPESTQNSWYLHPDGGLAPHPAPDSSPDTFVHSADDPVPTLGGATLLGPDLPSGPLDQAQIEKRDDVLVYTSLPMGTPLEVIGRVRLHLFASSTADSTDWVARLCDVDLNGFSRIITDGTLRATGAGEHVIDLWSTAHVFLPGHRLRVQIASSCFPRWDRHPAVGTARQSVYHDSARASRLVLPVPPVC